MLSRLVQLLVSSSQASQHRDTTGGPFSPAHCLQEESICSGTIRAGNGSGLAVSIRVTQSCTQLAVRQGHCDITVRTPPALLPHPLFCLAKPSCAWNCSVWSDPRAREGGGAQKLTGFSELLHTHPHSQHLLCLALPTTPSLWSVTLVAKSTLPARPSSA